MALYDKTGAAFSFDHEYAGTAYVRPLVKVFVQSGDDEDMREHEGFEPAGYLVSMDRSSLSDKPPLAVIDEEVAAKKAELDALKAEAKKVIRDIQSQQSAAEYKLVDAKRHLDQWMQTHKGMIDLGKLLDGKILYPLSVEENHYHKAREIPRIPKMNDIRGLRVEGGDFEKGQEWRAKIYMSDHYGTSFQFFDTAEERAAVIQSEFDATCAKFLDRPNFTVDIYTTTNLHYGTLLEWVKTHPALIIPDDIKSMKAADDASVVERRKAALAAELAAIDAA